MIGEKGYSAATVDEIVDAAGVSKGVAYYHFKSKAVMAESILEEGIGGLIEGFERIAAEAPTAPEALTGMVELFATSIFENKAFGRFFVSEAVARGSRVVKVHARLRGALVGRVGGSAGARSEGGLHPVRDRSSVRAVALIGMVLTTTLYYIGDESPLLGARLTSAQGHRRSEAKTVSSRVSSISSDTPTPPRGCWGRRGESVSGSEFGIVRDVEFFVALYFMPIRIVECEYGSE